MAAQGASELIHASRQGWDRGMTISSTPLALDPLGNSVSQFLSKHLLAFPADFLANHQLCRALRSFLIISSDGTKNIKTEDQVLDSGLVIISGWKNLLFPLLVVVEDNCSDGSITWNSMLHFVTYNLIPLNKSCNRDRKMKCYHCHWKFEAHGSYCPLLDSVLLVILKRSLEKSHQTPAEALWEA